jgi:cell division ATPase FtsA
VDMPFGHKPDLKKGVVVDFDQIHNNAIKPAIEGWRRRAGMKSARVGLSMGDVCGAAASGVCRCRSHHSVPPQPHQKKWFTS